MTNYYGYRINTSRRDFFKKELIEHKRLRQGWGYDPGQDLRSMTVNEGAARNKSMFKVKQGDVLLVPGLCSPDTVAIVRATEDFAKGYRFEIDPKEGDYGHIFPAEFVTEFRRHNPLVGSLKASLRTPMRFWGLNDFADVIERMIEAPKESLLSVKDYYDRYDDVEESVFDAFSDEIKDKLYVNMNSQFSESEWEFALVRGLQKLYPHYKVLRVGGKAEKEHGADIIIKIPSPLTYDESYYIIAIQVKDYSNSVGFGPIDQVLKADNYQEWHNEQNKLLEKWVILTKCQKNLNLEFVQYAASKNVKVIWGEDLKELLYIIAMKGSL
ncbi:hypothetical protein [Fibrobacter sp. UWH1]|uniref:hypothetical protein n=1 Tax=Fibrobacter sp. UWH1 TaxID=1964354 RepID=UPI0011304D9E|nr:hypothetical protein [Fibrobacter sp. UWH1]